MSEIANVWVCILINGKNLNVTVICLNGLYLTTDIDQTMQFSSLFIFSSSLLTVLDIRKKRAIRTRYMYIYAYTDRLTLQGNAFHDYHYILVGHWSRVYIIRYVGAGIALHRSYFATGKRKQFTLTFVYSTYVWMMPFIGASSHQSMYV